MKKIFFTMLILIFSVKSVNSSEFTSFGDQFEIALRRQNSGVPFDAPLKPIWKIFFKESIQKIENFLSARPSINKEHFEFLHVLEKKGNDLFANNLTGETSLPNTMNTHWYQFLHKRMADILSKVQVQEDETVSIQLGRKEELDRPYEEKLNDFLDMLYVRENYLPEARRFLIGCVAHVGDCFKYPSSSVFFDPKDEHGKIFSASKMSQSITIQYDCLTLPYINDNGYLPPALLIKSLVSRILSGGIPTVPSSYDFAPISTAIELFEHDEEHGGFFAPTQGIVVENLGLEIDPLIPLKELYKIIQETDGQLQKKLEAGFFLAVHELMYPFKNGDFDQVSAALQCANGFEGLAEMVRFRYPFDDYPEGKPLQANGSLYPYYETLMDCGVILPDKFLDESGKKLPNSYIYKEIEEDFFLYLKREIFPLLKKVQDSAEEIVETP